MRIVKTNSLLKPVILSLMLGAGSAVAQTPRPLTPPRERTCNLNVSLEAGQFLEFRPFQPEPKGIEGRSPCAAPFSLREK
jgi:hypothetical protein